MTQTNQNAIQQKKPMPVFNQAPHPIPPQKTLTEENVKEVVMEMLIGLDLIPRSQKKKAITIE